MNIVIFGGGTPGKLGNRLAILAQNHGHKVVSLSHKEHNNNRVETIVCNMKNDVDVLKKFEEVVTQLGSVDLVLYCSRNFDNPNITTELFDRGDFNIAEYYNTLTINAIIPHKIALLAHRLKLPMHMVFFTTFLAIGLKEEKEFTKYAGYIGGKAWQLHLMRSLNSIKSTISSSALTMHFNWDGSQEEENKVMAIYDLAVNNYKKTTGKIIALDHASESRVVDLEVLNHCQLFEHIDSSGDAQDSKPMC